MKKQFFRVKQLADQTFLRADKSEVLNHEELQIADHKVEYLRTAISAILKRIPNSTQGGDVDKRAKKCIEYHLATIFTEQGNHRRGGDHQTSIEDDCQLFQSILRDCGSIEQNLAREYAEHEIKVEEMVSGPLQLLLDNEFPNILKHKRNLSKYILDKDSASNRYHSTKKEALKDDMEEADTKVEQCRDMFANEMFSLLARENEFSSYILQLLKLQRGFHESALKNLEGIIPELEKKIGDSNVKRVFGISLKEHLRVTEKRIAYPLEICITVLTKLGLHEEGLFRIAGGMLRVKRLKSAIDSGCLTYLIPEYQDVHVLASTLKLYLRELPEPLLTYDLHDEWMHAMLTNDRDERLTIALDLLKKLPEENFDNLAYLIKFLAKLAQHPENKMSSSNIAIVMAPNLLWAKNEETNMNMGNCATVNMLVEFFIKEVDHLFPDDVSKFVNLNLNLIQEDPTMVTSKRYDNSDTVSLVSEASIGIENVGFVDSPKPNSRTKKKQVAPVPPILSKTDQDIYEMKNDMHMIQSTSTGSYPSGSSTLNRPKSKDTKIVKQSIGINTDDNALSLNLQNRNNLLVDTKTKNSAQMNDCDNSKNFKTTVTHRVSNTINDTSPKPIAAPRTTDLQTVRNNNSNNNSNNNNQEESMTTATTTTTTTTTAVVQLRRTENERISGKPEVPARPASLPKRASTDAVLHADPASLHRTQCSVYSVANKQQPSIVNIRSSQSQHQPGHDNLLSEKERFLGHVPSAAPRMSIDGTTTSKPGLPPKSLILKSNEKLNENEKLNGAPKSSHVRTRSDGNLIELTDGNLVMRTPPSPRSLNKPTQPPPPPPVIVQKTEPDSTNL